MFFVYFNVVFFSGWILTNSVLLARPLDPFPFTFLTLIVSLEAIFLSIFILINQNHETVVSDRRNHLDLQINLLAEQEGTMTLKLLKPIAEKLGVDCDNEAVEALLNPSRRKDCLRDIQSFGRPRLKE